MDEVSCHLGGRSLAGQTLPRAVGIPRRITGCTWTFLKPPSLQCFRKRAKLVLRQHQSGNVPVAEPSAPGEP